MTSGEGTSRFAKELTEYAEAGALGVINVGKQQLGAFLKTFFHAYPDVSFRKLDMIVDGTALAWECLLNGTYENMGHNGMPARGRRISSRGVSTTRHVDDLIVSNGDFWNAATLAAQLDAS